jgi:LytS/YehU family sensor histidine kinase
MLYEALKIHDSAFYFHKSYITLKDSIYNLEKIKEIENLKINFDLDKKVLYNKMLLAENKNLNETNQKRKLLILVVIMLLIISLLAFAYWSFRKKALFEKKEREYNEKMLIKQMDPHFVFNAINSAQEYVLVNESDKAQNYLSKISQLIRLFLNYHSKNEILISEDLKVLKLYVEVESQRLNEPIKLTVVNNTEYDLDEIIIPPALIQPLIENAVWHGFRNTSNNELELTFEVKDTLLHIRISDNGKGFLSHEFQASSKGLNLLKERLALLNNRKSDCLVYGNNSSGGAYVEFFFPLKLRF